MASLYQKLLALELNVDEKGRPCPKKLTLSPEALEMWKAFFNEHAAEQLKMTGDLAAAWSKLEGYAARLALVIHCVRVANGEDIMHDQVDAESLRAGIALARWFGREARRAYDMMFVETAEEQERRELVEWISAQGGRVTARELMRHGHRHGTAEEAESALDALVKAGIGRWSYPKPASGPGRPSKVFILNPDDGTNSDKIAAGKPPSGDSVSVSSVSSEEFPF